jgi:putative ABC transport system substrate-binding protein
MRRRTFLAGLSSSGVWPLLARGEEAGGIPKVGLLLLNSEEEEKRQGVGEAFLRGLADQGYVVGKTVEVETRFGDGHMEKLSARAAELIDARVDVIVSAGEGVYAAARLTKSTPVVSVSVSGDLVALGFAGSLAHPGKLVTGMTSFGPEVVAKRLEALRQIVPGMRRVGVLLVKGRSTNNLSLAALDAAAPSARVVIRPLEVTGVEEYESSLDAALRDGVDGLVIDEAGIFYGDAKFIAALATARGLPTVGPGKTARDGMLVGFGVNIFAQFRRAAVFVDKIVKGAKPGDIPIERASRFQTIVNLKTAKALGLAIPPEVLARADEVIE